MASPTPLRLAIFEGLDSIDALEKSFFSDLGIEQAIVVLPNSAEYSAVIKNLTLDLQKDSRIEWIIDAEADALPALFYQALVKRHRHFIMRASGFIESSHRAAHSKYFDQARRSFNEICDLIELGRGYLDSGLLAISNTLENLDLLEKNPGVDGLNSLFKGMPAVIVSTGPSLGRSLEDLKKIQDRCLIISADASLKILLKAGITPHLVCTIERDEGTLDFYKNAMNELRGSRPHIVAFSLTPRTVVNEMQGPLWFAYRNISFFGFFEAQLPRGVISAGHSVAHACARLARHMECSEIVLIGQDLAYDPENFSSHSKGFSYDEMTEKSSLENLIKKIESRGEKLSYVEGNLHSKVPTSTFYQMFLREFEALVKDIGIPVRNATQGGAKISGTKWGNLLEFSRDWKAVPSPLSRLDKHHQTVKPHGRFEIETFLKLTSEPLNVLNQCSDLLQRQMLHLQDVNARSILITIAQELRGVQRKLLEDEVFRSLTVDIIGTRFVQIENRIARTSDTDESALGQRLGQLVEWFAECRLAIDKIRDLFEIHQAKNNSRVASSRE